ncbi:hypothetical protein KKY_2252 [Pelagibacterium halotolerans B2]|uniref:Uncharacterized protein n=1 Tax=Pelagibacterium halotolerans (strain DSM 22347 / JCM 15775 / CGMCC 1.7692 / B2) TaxID=1082931 RepID=G4R7G0_PELHB|nr:hypothetical protein KKY_2252 [Pelagibacterium halotolerans B2]
MFHDPLFPLSSRRLPRLYSMPLRRSCYSAAVVHMGRKSNTVDGRGKAEI